MTKWAAGLLSLILVASSCGYFELAEEPVEVDPAQPGQDSSDGDPPGSSSAPDDDDDDPSSSADPPNTDVAPPSWTRVALDLELIAEFEQAIALEPRSGTSDLYVAQRTGQIRRIRRTFTSNGSERISTSTRLVLDLSEQVSLGGERGLLDIEFSLDGRSLYVSYTDLDGASVIAEYPMDRSTQADPGQRRELLRLPQPQNNHNGGGIEVGADGFLYAAFGDGGGSGDPDETGQDPSTLLGTIIRIDPFPVGDEPYDIPDGNPFMDGGGRPEIWLTGVRNPWRFSFDSATGDLWIADVGQNEFEEIDLLTAATGGGRGANLGWNEMEGFEPFDGGREPDDHTPPLFAYPHEGGRCSVTGGHVYRGEALLLFDGVYVFGDYCTGEIFGLQPVSDGVAFEPLSISAAPETLVSFGVDGFGELYVVEANGAISRVVPALADGG